jgi:GNAT superfamily N-acetyltransferase
VIDDGKLIALASCVKLNDGSAELAFSIDADRRGTGLARKLLETTIDYAHAAGAAKLCMSCLRTNKKMRELAKSFGLNLTITYDEVYAELGISR